MQRLKTDFQAVDEDNHCVTIPVDSQLLAKHPTVMSNFKGGDAVAPPHELSFGLHWSHLDFVEQAVNKGHPSSSIDPLPQFVKDTLFEVARGDQKIHFETQEWFLQDLAC